MKCERCGRSIDLDDTPVEEIDEWHYLTTDGENDDRVCPDCLTPEEKDTLPHVEVFGSEYEMLRDAQAEDINNGLYDVVDPPVRELVRVLIEDYGLITHDSCGGYEWAAFGREPLGRWRVRFWPFPETEDAVRLLVEALLEARDDGIKVTLLDESYRGEPCCCLLGEGDPDVFADYLPRVVS
jgi:hypothetical protein